MTFTLSSQIQLTQSHPKDGTQTKNTFYVDQQEGKVQSEERVAYGLWEDI